jgi:23S rRNA pseudouridine1911/1915/1917 synthase
VRIFVSIYYYEHGMLASARHSIKFPIVYEDDAVIVIDKPAGMLTMATESEREKTAYAILRARANSRKPAEKIFIVHRLDREASGLVVFAKTVEAKERLQDQFKDHSAGRTYVALAEGRVDPDEFTIRSLLAENSAYRVYSTTNPKIGKAATTHVRILKRQPKATLLEVRLETGRKHQIRVHLAERGHPIVGDKFYSTSKARAPRLALHGAKLEFRHPTTGKVMKFESPVPFDGGPSPTGRNARS